MNTKKKLQLKLKEYRLQKNQKSSDSRLQLLSKIMHLLQDHLSSDA